MSKELTIKEEQEVMFSPDKIDLMKATICRGSTDEEFGLFLHACKRTGLDPFMRQIYAVKRYDSNLRREAMTIQTGIDGYRLIAERTGRYCPGREPTYVFDKNGHLESATAYVKKQTRDGTWHEVSACAFFCEYAQRKRDGGLVSMWASMPRGQLAKCAEALALRKAFPAELSGLYTKEEMQQSEAESTKEIVATKVTIEPVKEEKKEEPKLVTDVMVAELMKLFEVVPDYREVVEAFVMETMGVQSFKELSYDDFVKIGKDVRARTKEAEKEAEKEESCE